MPRLRANTEHGRNGWTSNNVEAMNKVLKEVGQWKPHKLPQLITAIKTVVVTQERQAEMAIYNEGDFMLKPELSAFLHDAHEWDELSDKRRKNILAKCYRLTTAPTVSKSTDGRLSVTRTPGAGKKKNQLRRQRSERTTSFRRRKC